MHPHLNPLPTKGITVTTFKCGCITRQGSTKVRSTRYFYLFTVAHIAPLPTASISVGTHKHSPLGVMLLLGITSTVQVVLVKSLPTLLTQIGLPHLTQTPLRRPNGLKTKTGLTAIAWLLVAVVTVVI